MSKWKTWSHEELMYLQILIESGHSNPEIAEIMDRPLTGIAIKSQRVCGGNPNYMKKKTKHKHLREPVMRYFLDHSAEQTMKKFKLTASEFKSLFVAGYMDPRLKHLRKDKRNKDLWTSRHYKILLQNSGLKPREEISKMIGKGNVNSCIKDRLRALKVASKSINGITISQYRSAFNSEPGFYIQTKAGPTGGVHSSSHWKIIPWVYLEKEINDKKIKAPKITKDLVSAMALFQNWIFEGKAYERLVK